MDFDNGIAQFSSNAEAHAELVAAGYEHDTCGVWHRADGAICIAVGDGSVHLVGEGRGNPEDNDYDC